MSFGTPYNVVNVTQAGGVSTTLSGNYLQAAAVGDILIVGVGNNGTGNYVTNFQDSKGNPFYLADNNYGTSDNNQVFVCVVRTATTTSDTLTVTLNTTGGSTVMLGRGISGGVGWNVIDVAVDTFNAASASPSATTPPLRQSVEYACAFLCNANGGGSPSTWTGGFTQQATGHVTNNTYYTVADQITSSTSALTAGCTIVSAAWSMIIVTVRAASSSVSPVIRTGSGTFGTGAATATTLSYTVPSGTVAGDTILFYAAGITNGQTFSATGYTAVAATGTASTAGALLYKTAVGGDASSSVTVTKSGAASAWVGLAISVGGGSFDPSTPTAGGQINTASTTITTPGLTLTNTNDLGIWIGTTRAGAAGGTPGTITVPSGFSNVVTQQNTTSGSVANMGIIAGSTTFTASGATGNQNGTDGTSQANIGLLLAFSGSTITAATINFYDEMLMNVPVIDAAQW